MKNQLQTIDKNSLDICCRELILRILKSLLMKAAELKIEAIGELLDTCDAHGWSLIHYFAYLNYAQALKLIITAGANVNLSLNNQKKDSPLMIATMHNNESAISTLVKLGADIINTSRNPKGYLRVP